MNSGAIITTIVMWLIFIGGFICFSSQRGKGGKWED